MSRRRKTAEAKPPLADKLEWRPIDSLRAHPENSRKHDAEQISMLRGSLRSFGWTRPIMVVDDVAGLEPGTVFVGHGFWEAAKAEGHTQAKVLVAENWTAAQVRAYMIADNQLPLGATWDDDVLKRELEALRTDGFDLAALGFNQAAVDAMFAVPEAENPKQGVAGSLAESFGIPPFSVFNAREGWWQTRKAQWLALGIRSEVGRGEGAEGKKSHKDAPGGGGRLWAGKDANGKTAAATSYGKPRRKANAEPGGSKMPAANYSKSRARGNGKGQPV
jgi:hypothetical protein